MDGVMISNHHPCPECGSSDGAATYSSGWSHCFVCNKNYREDGDYEMDGVEELGAGLVSIDSRDIKSRGLSAATCAKYGYGAARVNGVAMQVANYRRKGKVVAQHYRDAEKNFTWSGFNNGLELFGQHLWQRGGKQLIITEGEIDCLTWAQTRELRWPVVAVPGTGSIKMIKHNLDWISSFAEVVLYFDDDEPGQAFAAEVAELLPPGLARVGHTQPFKDTNDLYLSEGSTTLYNTLWQAVTWAPAELTTAREVLLNSSDVSSVLDYCWPGLQAMTKGIRETELILVCAGTNVGKSLVAKNMAFNYLKDGKRIGFIALEEPSSSVLDSFLAFENGVTITSMGDVQKELKVEMLDDCDWEDRVTFYTDRGLSLSDTVLQRARYMARANDVDIIFIDHISAVFARMTEGNRAQSIEAWMYQAQQLAHDIQVPIVAVCHLRDPENGKKFSEGAEPRIEYLLGSSSLSRVPDTIIGAQRNVLDEDTRHITKLILLKSRFNGMAVSESITLTADGSMLKETDVFEDDDYEEGGDF